MQCATDNIKYIGSLLHSFFFHALKLASLFCLSHYRQVCLDRFMLYVIILYKSYSNDTADL